MQGRRMLTLAEKVVERKGNCRWTAVPRARGERVHLWYSTRWLVQVELLLTLHLEFAGWVLSLRMWFDRISMLSVTEFPSVVYVVQVSSRMWLGLPIQTAGWVLLSLQAERIWCCRVCRSSVFKLFVFSPCWILLSFHWLVQVECCWLFGIWNLQVECWVCGSSVTDFACWVLLSFQV